MLLPVVAIWEKPEQPLVARSILKPVSPVELSVQLKLMEETPIEPKAKEVGAGKLVVAVAEEEQASPSVL